MFCRREFWKTNLALELRGTVMGFSLRVCVWAAFIADSFRSQIQKGDHVPRGESDGISEPDVQF